MVVSFYHSGSVARVNSTDTSVRVFEWRAPSLLGTFVQGLYVCVLTPGKTWLSVVPSGTLVGNNPKSSFEPTHLRTTMVITVDQKVEGRTWYSTFNLHSFVRTKLI